jgi:hypothetical protein
VECMEQSSANPPPEPLGAGAAGGHKWIAELRGRGFTIEMGPELFFKQKIPQTGRMLGLNTPKSRRRWLVLASKEVEGTVHHALFYHSEDLNKPFRFRKQSLPLDTSCNVIDGNHEHTQRTRKPTKGRSHHLLIWPKGHDKSPNWFSVHVGMGLKPAGEDIGLIDSKMGLHDKSNVKVKWYSLVSHEPDSKEAPTAGQELHDTADEQHTRWFQAIWRARQGDQATCVGDLVLLPGDRWERVDKLRSLTEDGERTWRPGSRKQLVEDPLNAQTLLGPDEFD